MHDVHPLDCCVIANVDLGQISLETPALRTRIVACLVSNENLSQKMALGVGI